MSEETDRKTPTDEEIAEKVVQKFIVDSMVFAYSIGNTEAKKCLMRDIKKRPLYWFNSADVDESVRKVIEFAIAESEKRFLAVLDARIAEEKELVRAICIGTVHPDQADRKEFTRWLQDTVIFHLGDMEKKLRAGIEGTREEVG